MGQESRNGWYDGDIDDKSLRFDHADMERMIGSWGYPLLNIQKLWKMSVPSSIEESTLNGHVQ